MTTRARKSPPVEATKIEVDPDQAPKTLDECRRCVLWHDATQGVGGEGPRHAPIMMVGEQPGDKEDLAGHPFVGPAGALLDAALGDAGIDRDLVFITNAVKHFKWEPRGKRRMHKTPAQREIDACGYWFEKELESVGPRVIVALGATALRAVLHDRGVTLTRVLGTTLEHESRAVIPTYHPSYALRVPDKASRERAYGAIVAALQRAGEISRLRA